MWYWRGKSCCNGGEYVVEYGFWEIGVRGIGLENKDSENILVVYCICNICVNWLFDIIFVFIYCLM